MQSLKILKNAESNAIYRKITTYAIACISFLICVFNPYALYATDITQFDSTQTLSTLCALFGAFLITSFIAIYLISFIPKKFAKISAFIFSLTLFIGLVYSFILVGDYGVMDHFILQRTPKNSAREILIFIAIVSFGIALIAFALKKLLRLWQIIFLTLFVVSGVNVFQIIDKRLDSQLSSLRGGVSEANTTKQSIETKMDCHDSTQCVESRLSLIHI